MQLWPQHRFARAMLLFLSERNSFALSILSRRAVLSTAAVVASAAAIPPAPASAAAADDAVFQTTAYGRQEYTNSITASRDTNLSPAEAYDVIRQKIPQSVKGGRAVDVGAGAGLSTAVLYVEKGYRDISAVDWSATAWDESVTEQPASIQFYEMDDTAFFKSHADNDKFDCIVYNFAVNTAKAVFTASHYLTDTGVLLAPCNDRTDYWYKQTYSLLNASGEVTWKSAPEVGAWSVQFQPDVTSPNCTGIWCGNSNGFLQQNQQQQLR